MKNKRKLLVLAIGAWALGACTQDNVHAPEQEIVVIEKEGDTMKEVFEDSLYFEGILTSSVPSMPSLMNPVDTPDFLQFKGMTDKTSGYATIVLGQFNINVEAMGMNIAIGEMEIDSIQYAFYPNGNGMFFRDDFDVMAGQYETKGSLYGTFDAGGSVRMIMNYKPGSMPFEVESELNAVRK